MEKRIEKLLKENEQLRTELEYYRDKTDEIRENVFDTEAVYNTCTELAGKFDE